MEFTINKKVFLIEYLKDEIIEIGCKDGKSYPTKYGKYNLYIKQGESWEKLLGSYTYPILYRVAYRVATHKKISIDCVPEFIENIA